MEKIILVQEQPIINYTIVEVPVTANGLGQVAIPDQPMLKSYSNHKIVVKAIELITPKVLAKAPTSGNATSPLAEMQKATLVLYCNGWEREQNIPLLRLNAMNDSDSTAATTVPFAKNVQAFENLSSVDWTKSRIQYSNGSTSASSTYAFLFGVQYVVYNDQGEQITP